VTSPIAASGAGHLVGEGPSRCLLLPVLEAVPELAHAFTVSGSDPAAVTASVASHPLPLFTLRQMHGAQVVAVDDSMPVAPANPAPPGDALVTARRGVALCVHVADCVPILLADPVSGFLGAVHAGWRGTVAGVLAATLRMLRARGGRAADVRMAMGPSIAACCFEVGAEVLEAFRRSAPGTGPCILPGPRPRIDLIEANRRQALALGVAPKNIGAAGLCTACRPDLLESYRRSGGAPGRMAGIIAWRS
jgi:YfiH family protein